MTLTLSNTTLDYDKGEHGTTRVILRPRGLRELNCAL